MAKKNVAILISGGGGLMKRAIINEKRDNCNYFVKSIIACKEKCQGLNIAKELGKNTYFVEFGSENDWIKNSETLFSLIDSIGGIDYIVMLGFTKKLILNSNWKGRVYNIHPSLLPDFGGKGMIGKKVHEAVIKAKVKKSGFTIHSIDDEYDKGQIITQYEINVEANDNAETLQEKIINLQHEKLYEIFLNLGVWNEK